MRDALASIWHPPDSPYSPCVDEGFVEVLEVEYGVRVEPDTLAIEDSYDELSFP